MGKAEIEENDYNLSISTYVEKEDTREIIDIKVLNSERESMNVDIVIPSYKPDSSLHELVRRLNEQTIVPRKIVIINTGDEFLDGEMPKNVEILFIRKDEFDHGATRNQAISHTDSEYFICMTQDAMPRNKHLIEELLKPFAEKSVAISYARQVPRADANPIEKYTRGHNYPNVSDRKTLADRDRLGIKLYFASNVCACFRREIFKALGGFPENLILNEDMIYAHAVIHAGYAICYAAAAEVLHSHNYSGWQQLIRNFDIGSNQADFPDVFGGMKSESEGKAMVMGNLKYLLQKRHVGQAIRLIYVSGCKYIGYKLGKNYKKLPNAVCKFFSMNKRYWKK